MQRARRPLAEEDRGGPDSADGPREESGREEFAERKDRSSQRLAGLLLGLDG